MNWQAATFFSTAVLAIAGLLNLWVLQSIKLQILELENRIREWAHGMFSSTERVNGLEARIARLEHE